MKPNLIKRVAAAVALAVLAAMVSACGSSNGGAATGIGPSIANGSGCTGSSQAVAFSGVAAMDSYGNVYAGQNVGPLTLSAVGTASPGGYQFGRINTTDGSTLEFNLSGSYGSQMSIQGVYIMGQDVYSVLQGMGSEMGYGYSYPTQGYGYGTGAGCGVSSFTIYEMGVEPMTEAASVIGEQPFTYALVSGELLLNNEINAPY